MTRNLPTCDPKRILVVDDNRMGLSARRSVLEAIGHTVTTAPSAIEALQLFTSGSTFDLVITDYKMPKMTGVELIAEIRKTNPALPIILISGFIDTLGLTEANTLADAVLQKSSSEVTQMTRTVSKLLNKTHRKPAGSSKGPVTARGGAVNRNG